jgi:hypothetical protein
MSSEFCILLILKEIQPSIGLVSSNDFCGTEEKKNLDKINQV